MIYDETKINEIHDLSYIKYFPYVLGLYCILMFVPFMLWRDVYGAKIGRQLEFLMNGFVEGFNYFYYQKSSKYLRPNYGYRWIGSSS